MLAHGGGQVREFGVAPDEAAGRGPQVPLRSIKGTQRGKLRTQALGADLEHPHRVGDVPQPPWPQLDQVDPAQQTGGLAVQKDLTAMPGGHHPGRPVEHRTEVVRPPQLGLPGRNPHPHRQFQCLLGGDRSLHRCPG